MYSLLYEEVDEGGVEIVRILGFPCTQADLRPDVEEFRYLLTNQRAVFLRPVINDNDNDNDNDDNDNDNDNDDND